MEKNLTVPPEMILMSISAFHFDELHQKPYFHILLINLSHLVEYVLLDAFYIL